MNNNQMIEALTMLLIVMVCILFVLCTIFVILKMKNNKPKKEKKQVNPETKGSTVVPQSYNKQSIFKFMEFDKIEDNMIVQKDGKRFVMIIECQGVNYDLMSGLEKNSVEQGFLQFLNTLRFPIQIYVQTRTVNLGESLNSYNERVENISREFASKQAEYNQKVRSGEYSDEELEKEKYELARQRNLYEYGMDIVKNTERMSLNKNILSKHYYIILSYYPEEAANSTYGKEEIANLAFSELYTKCQAIINSLGMCEIKSKILDSTELTELLYVAFNRDESEVFDLKRALNAGYEDLYSTAPDVFDKRIKELDAMIEREAIKKANDAMYEAAEETQKERQAKQKQAQLEQLIDQMAKIIVEDNMQNIGNEVAEKAIDKLENKTKEEGGEENGKKTKSTRRKSTKSA